MSELVSVLRDILAQMQTEHQYRVERDRFADALDERDAQDRVDRDSKLQRTMEEYKDIAREFGK